MESPFCPFKLAEDIEVVIDETLNESLEDTNNIYYEWDSWLVKFPEELLINRLIWEDNKLVHHRYRENSNGVDLFEVSTNDDEVEEPEFGPLIIGKDGSTGYTYISTRYVPNDELDDIDRYPGLKKCKRIKPGVYQEI